MALRKASPTLGSVICLAAMLLCWSAAVVRARSPHNVTVMAKRVPFRAGTSAEDQRNMVGIDLLLINNGPLYLDYTRVVMSYYLKVRATYLLYQGHGMVPCVVMSYHL
eukprot:jgi/Mesvir1/8914/Mv14200-RA.1